MADIHILFFCPKTGILIQIAVILVTIFCRNCLILHIQLKARWPNYYLFSTFQYMRKFLFTVAIALALSAEGMAQTDTSVA